MPSSLSLSTLKGMVPFGLRFGASYVVEFDPDSPWYETSLTMAADALKQGQKTEYHTFMHPPDRIRESLSNLGLDVKKHEQQGSLRILDTYDVMTGLEVPETLEGVKGQDSSHMHHFDLVRWSDKVAKMVKEGVGEDEKRWLHIDDNTSILNHYSEERIIVDIWRTRFIPYIRLRELVMINSLVAGFASESFYRQFESLCDGIIDLKSKEERGQIGYYARVRMMRERPGDSRWRSIRVLENGEVHLDRAIEEPGTGKTGHSDAAVRSLLSTMNTVPLSRYRVVGSYTRYDEKARNLLKDLKQKILAGLESSVPKHDNYLIWAPPGTGKTFFGEQVSESLKHGARYHYVNLAEMDESSFRSLLSDLEKSKGPSLCFVDETDSRMKESWPYEALLPLLDTRLKSGGPRVFILAGSSGASLAEMKRAMASRPKGSDLLSRIPQGNEYEIPAMTPEDRILVAISSFHQAGKDLGRDVAEVEKLALYYVALNEELTSARRLQECAVRGVERMPPREDRVKYDNLFSPGDEQSKEFWSRVRSSEPELINTYVRIED